MFLAMGLERELGFRPRLRKRGPGFRFERVGYWLRFREKEKARFSAMKLERERERERAHLQQKPPSVTSDPT